MVQRKSPNKLGIQPDSHNYDKSPKWATFLEPPSSLPPEVRNKGGSELNKKMMKKSGSIKRSDFDIMRSNSMRRRRPDKQLNAAATTQQKPSRFMVTTPQKVARVKVQENSPSYMKPTSSSAARKDRAQVPTPHASKTSGDGKNPNRKSSITPKLTSSSGRKPGKTLAKLASIRPVRILTKTFSIKPRRTSIKKNSGVALDTLQEVRRATCSSTLKDSRFPPCVGLHSGGTESEGTSVMKVCPYTYCSLNGHHHAELPPLKSFVSAKRRLLKTQKSIRLKNLPSIRRRSSGKPREDISTGQREDDAIPEEEEEGEDWDSFVKMYAQPKENTTKPMGRNSDDGNDKLKNFYSVDPLGLEDASYSTKDSAETEVKNDFEQYAESLSDDSSYSTVSFEDYIDGDIEFVMDEMDALLFSDEYIKMEEAGDKDHSLYTAQIETDLGNFSREIETGENESNDSVSDKSDKNCKEEEFVDRRIANVSDCSILTSDKHYQIVCLHGLTDTDETPFNEALQFVHVEGNEYLQEEFDATNQNLEIELPTKISSKEPTTTRSRSLQDPLPSDEDVYEKSEEVSEEEKQEDKIHELIFTDVSSDATECQLEDPVYMLLKDENSTVHAHDEHETQLEEEKYDSSELEIHRSIVLEDPNADAEVDRFLPEENVVDARAKVPEEKEEWPEEKERNIFSSKFCDEHSYEEECNLKSVEDCSPEEVKIEVEDGTGAEYTTTTDDESDVDQEHPENYSNISTPIRRKREIEEPKEPREFNPRGPRFLPLDPEEDPETVDLRHQTMDERRNSEEWMVDYALRETVRKLTPARSRKVKLLVEAFETVPIPDYETHLPQTPTDFSSTSFMQSCN